MSVTKRLCEVDNCNRTHQARGMCNRHYNNFLYSQGRFNTHPLYSTWSAMKRRCSNINDAAYQRYGGRGIKVCERWKGLNGFSNFLADMGEKPSPELTLDRIDNNGDYSPGNCRWTTPSIQNMNRRVQSNSSSGITGVIQDKRTKRWLARIMYVHLGSFKTKEEAIACRKAAEEKYFKPLLAKN